MRRLWDQDTLDKFNSQRSCTGHQWSGWEVAAFTEHDQSPRPVDKWRMHGQHFIQDAGERPDVHGAGVCVALFVERGDVVEDFRCGVQRRSDLGLQYCVVVCDTLRHSEITNLHPPVWRMLNDEDVLRDQRYYRCKQISTCGLLEASGLCV